MVNGQGLRHYVGRPVALVGTVTQEEGRIKTVETSDLLRIKILGVYIQLERGSTVEVRGLVLEPD